MIALDYKKNSNSFDIPIESHFQPKDIGILAANCFGLRHVTGEEQSSNEARFGFHQGCSLSLSPNQSNFPSTWSNLEDQGVKEKYAALFEKGVDHFIKGSLSWDLLEKIGPIDFSDGKQTKVEVVASLVNSCFFSIVNYRTSLTKDKYCDHVAVDHKMWGLGLGRFPKSNKDSSSIITIPKISIDSLGYSKEELDMFITESSQFNSLQDQITACYRTALIEEIRSKLK
jgi:hypothetical protein